MFYPDRLTQFATERFNQAIYSLRDDGISPVSDMARRIIGRIRDGEVRVALDLSFTQQTTTALGMLEVPYAPGRPLYAPQIRLEAGRMLTFTQVPDRIEADLVRTLAVVDQIPDQGYQRRWSMVYGDALDTQTAWLNKKGVGFVDEDPRFFPEEELLRGLLGVEKFYGDTGFEDWQAVIDELLADKESRAHYPILRQLRGATGHFLAMRERFAAMSYKAALVADGANRLMAATEDERAKVNALALLGPSIVAGTDNLN